MSPARKLEGVYSTGLVRNLITALAFGAAVFSVGLSSALLPSQTTWAAAAPAAPAAASTAPKKDAKGKLIKPQTKVTQTLSQKTYKQMELAQKAFEVKDYKGAEAALTPLKLGYEKLNDYEKATLWNLYAAVFRSQDDNKRAIEAYANLLKTPNVPDGLRDGALFSMAQTYFVIDDYKSAISVLNKWFAVVTDVQPDAYILLAQAYYQLQDYKGAKTPILKALTIAKQRNMAPKENWLGLLRAVFYELQDYPHATQVMEALVTAYPKDSYFLQLSGLYGLSGDQAKQTDIMHIAYLGGYVTKQADLLNLARLYLAQGAPARAVDVLKAKMRDKTIELTAENLQLLAQTLSIAKEIEQAIPVLTKLSAMTGESKHFLYLGQAYNELGDAQKASDALRGALNGKNVNNPGNIQMQLGTALYNAKKLQEARSIFSAAATSSSQAGAASNWVKFISSEIDRNEQLKAR